LSCFFKHIEPLLYLCQSLIQIGDKIVCIFQTDRQAKHVFADTGLFQFFRTQLTMSCRCRMSCQRTGITDIDQTGKQFEAIQYLGTCFAFMLPDGFTPKDRRLGALPFMYFCKRA